MKTLLHFRWLGVAVAAGAVLLSGCATTATRQALANELSARPVEQAMVTNVERGKPLSLGEIEHSLEAGVPEPVLVDYLESTRATYQLTAEDVDRLRASGAGDELVNHLLASPTRYGSRSYRYHGGHYYHRPFYYHPRHYHPYRYRHGFHFYGRHHSYGFRGGRYGYCY